MLVGLGDGASEVRGQCHPISAGWCGRELLTEGLGNRIAIVFSATEVLPPQAYSKALLRIHPTNRSVIERIRRLLKLIGRIPVKAIVVIEDCDNVEGPRLCRLRGTRAQVHAQ